VYTVLTPLRLASVCLALSLVCGPTARAQDSAQARPPSPVTTTSIVTGTVISAQDSQPLMGVQVLIKGTRHWAITNQNGRFRLERLTPGTATIEFRPANRAPLSYPLTLEAGKTTNLAVQVDTRSVALPEVVVEGDDKPAAKMGEFIRHKDSGHGGYFITRAEIEKKQPRVMSDMLRSIPGLRVDCGFGTCQVQSFEEARRIMGGCPIQYFLDGTPFSGDIDELTPDQVEGIEIYRGSSTIPPEFNTGTSMCGVIAVWSRVPGK
jgi:CarboxypepD_reg-like domain/TonB-dependent Receptor Plug Domain